MASGKAKHGKAKRKRKNKTKKRKKGGSSLVSSDTGAFNIYG